MYRVPQLRNLDRDCRVRLWKGCIISTFLVPDDPNWDFSAFYTKLAERCASLVHTCEESTTRLRSRFYTVCKLSSCTRSHSCGPVSTSMTALPSSGCVIYPGKLTKAECFRLGNIGRMFPADIEHVVGAIRHSLLEMGVALPVQQTLAR